MDPDLGFRGVGLKILNPKPYGVRAGADNTDATGQQMSSVFWWLNLVRLYSLYNILYPKRRIESYSILGTIISPNKILLKSVSKEPLKSLVNSHETSRGTQGRPQSH